MKKRELIEITIDKMNFGGISSTIVEDKTVEIKGGITGQRAKVLIKKVRKEKAEGKILEVLERSSIETEATCPHYGFCGGCSMLSVPYEKQVDIKSNQLKELFDDAGFSEIDYLGVKSSPKSTEYRNKMEYTFGDMSKGGELTLGMHVKNQSFGVITTDECKLVSPDFNKILKTTLDYFSDKNLPYYRVMPRTGYLRHLVLRRGENTGDIIVNLVTTTQVEFDLTEWTNLISGLELEGKVVGVLHTLNDSFSDIVQCDKLELLYGQDFFSEKVLGLNFKVSPFSFLQTNTRGSETLYSLVREWIGTKEGRTVFDLYSGTGTIGQVMSPIAKEVIGIEIVEEAVEMAKDNAKLNGLENCTFIAGDVTEEVGKLKERPDLIILDPPRAGIHPRGLMDIISFDAKELIYVSCNPKALMNDLKVLTGRGYKIVKAQGVDMFPNTPHCEAVVKLEKN